MICLNMNNGVLLKDEHGRRDIEFSPLGYDDLKKWRTSRSFDLEAIVPDPKRYGFSANNSSDPMLCRLSVENSSGLDVIALVPGGWLPAAYCKASLLFLDSNVAGSFASISQDINIAKKHYQEALSMSPGITGISLVLAGFEGHGRLPSFDEYRRKTRELIGKAKTGFPDFNFHQASKKWCRVAYDEIMGYEDSIIRNMKFIEMMTPHLGGKVSSGNLHNLLKKATDWAVANPSALTQFTYFLMVDCIFDNGPSKENNESAGRLILKPAKPKTASNRFNAIMDIMQMHFVVNRQQYFPNDTHVIATKDRGMALAWSMLKPGILPSGNSIPAKAAYNFDSSNFAARLKGHDLERFIAECPMR